MKKIRIVLALAAALVLLGCGAVKPPLGPPDPADVERNAALAFRLDVLDGTRVVGHGTGAVISRDGYILTANHVVEHGGLGVSMDGGGPYPLVYFPRVIATDEERDLAVVKIDWDFDQAVVLADPRDVRAGDSVYTVGYSGDLQQTVHRMTVEKRLYDDPDGVVEGVMLLDFGVIPGDSGGGVFSARTGEFVGVAVAVFSSEVGGFDVSYSVVVPVEQVRDFLDKNDIPFDSAALG